MSKIMAFFCQCSTAGKDLLEEISVQGNMCQHQPFGKHPLVRCVQLAGFLSTKFLRFPRLTAPIFDIHSGNAR